MCVSSYSVLAGTAVVRSMISVCVSSYSVHNFELLSGSRTICFVRMIIFRCSAAFAHSTSSMLQSLMSAITVRNYRAS